MKLLTEFFKPAIKNNQMKFFKQLEKEVNHEEIKKNIEQISKQGRSELQFRISELNFKCLDHNAFEKSWVVDGLCASLALSVLSRDIPGFKENLYAIYTILSLEDTIKTLKNVIHYNQSWMTLSGYLLDSIHKHTWVYWGDSIDKEEKYFKSQDFHCHKQLIDLFRELDLTESLKEHAKMGQEAFVGESPAFTWKIPKRLVEYIENNGSDLEKEGPEKKGKF